MIYVLIYTFIYLISLLLVVCPSQVQNISVTQIEKGLNISWTEPLETNGLTGYQLEITANNELINKTVSVSTICSPYTLLTLCISVEFLIICCSLKTM